MRFITLLVLASLTLFTACGLSSTKNNVYVPPENPGGQLCVNQCSKANNYCHETCDLSSRQCVMKAQTQAIQDYDAYTREQFRIGEPIEFHPHDFERMTVCTNGKKQCEDNCESQFASCYKTCGGTVQ